MRRQNGESKEAQEARSAGKILDRRELHKQGRNTYTQIGVESEIRCAEKVREGVKKNAARYKEEIGW